MLSEESAHLASSGCCSTITEPFRLWQRLGTCATAEHRHTLAGLLHCSQTFRLLGAFAMGSFEAAIAVSPDMRLQKCTDLCDAIWAFVCLFEVLVSFAASRGRWTSRACFKSWCASQPSLITQLAATSELLSLVIWLMSDLY